MARSGSVLQRGGTVKMQMVGLDELLDDLKNISNDFRDQLATVALVGADEIKNEAERLAPGPNIITDLEKLTRSRATVAIGPDTAHWYYLFFETGAAPHEIRPDDNQALKLAMGDEFAAVIRRHPGMAASPFLRPAVDKKDQAAAEKAAQVLWVIINRYSEKAD